MTAESAAPVAVQADRNRRRRRSREDVVQRICFAARQLFAERGYHGATTREIARLADVSETLLFRYFGNKSALFDEVVAQPFNRLMQDFLEKDPHGDERRAAERRNFSEVYRLFEENRSLFLAILSNSGQVSEDDNGPSFQGILAFFKAATEAQLKKYIDLGEDPPFDIGLGLRLAFGMLASSVLLRDWLFPDCNPSQAEIVSLIEILVGRALDPASQPPCSS